jgi:hypothetical protein
MKYPLVVIEGVLEESMQIKINHSQEKKELANTFKPHCIGVNSANGIRRVNNSQRRIANDQISDAFVNVPFSNTKINDENLKGRLLKRRFTFRSDPSWFIKFNIRFK